MDTQRVNMNVDNAVKINPHIQANPTAVQPGKSFGETLAIAANEKVQDSPGLRFSKHAAARLNSREVDLSPEQLKRVENGVTAAFGKGVSDSLVLVDGYALVVNTKSKTVVTAMQNGQKPGVFTNINGAVIV